MPSSRLRARELAQLLVGEGGDDQQDQVSAVRAGFPDLVLVDHEVLAQHRNVHRGTDGVQIGERAAEAALLGQDTDHGGPAVGVLRGERRGVRDAGEVALGGAAALDLGDDLEFATVLGQPAEGSPGVPGRSRRQGAVLQFREGHEALPVLHVLPDTGVDVVENSHD
jgi:hypothetical protein